MSQKTTVSCRRSADGASGSTMVGVGTGLGARGGGAESSDVPHMSQKFAPASASAPQDGHTSGSDCPQCEQNFAPCLLLWPQCGHSISYRPPVCRLSPEAIVTANDAYDNRVRGEAARLAPGLCIAPNAL